MLFQSVTLALHDSCFPWLIQLLTPQDITLSTAPHCSNATPFLDFHQLWQDHTGYWFNKGIRFAILGTGIYEMISAGLILRESRCRYYTLTLTIYQGTTRIALRGGNSIVFRDNKPSVNWWSSDPGRSQCSDNDGDSVYRHIWVDSLAALSEPYVITPKINIDQYTWELEYE